MIGFRRAKRVGLGIGLASGLGVLGSSPVRADDRYPIWPTELTRISDRIYDLGGTTEGERMAAFDRLHHYATPVISEIVVRSVSDPSAQIRKAALDMCVLRSIHACIPGALHSWNTGSDRGERMRALKVVALDPTEARALVLFGALKDPDDFMRGHAIRLVATAPFPPDGVEEARRRLLAKLTDAAAGVRGEAAVGLAQLGGGEASLAVVRLLSDPDPNVREQAAIALGRFADPRTRAALTRAVERGGTPSFVREAINALASLPGPEVEAQLLTLLDDPPDPSLRRSFVAEAIGRRVDPSDTLVDGLVERLRVPVLHGDVLAALRRLGDAAVPRVERARARGLEPSLAADLDDLLAARHLPEKARPAAPPLPAPTDRDGWRARLRRADSSLDEGATDPGGTDRAAVGLGRLHPAWMGDAVAGAVERAGRPRDARPWLIALASTPATVLDDKGDAWFWMRLATWAHDPRGSAEDRCLALAALGAAEGTRHAKALVRQIGGLASAQSSAVRTCLAMSAGRLQDASTVAVLLRDPVAEVRAGAAIGVANLRRVSAELRSTLATVGAHDPVSGARTCATWALGHLERGPAPATLFRARQPRHWDVRAGWLALRGPDGARVAIPVVGPRGAVPEPDSLTEEGPGRRWALVPGLPEHAVEEADSYMDPGIVSLAR